MSLLYIFVISGQVLRFSFIPAIHRRLCRSIYSNLSALDGDLPCNCWVLAGFMECSQYHFSQAARLLHYCLRWHWVGARPVQFLIGGNPLFWINGGITQVLCSFFFLSRSLCYHWQQRVRTAKDSCTLHWFFSHNQSATLVMCNSNGSALKPEQD